MKPLTEAWLAFVKNVYDNDAWVTTQTKYAGVYTFEYASQNKVTYTDRAGAKQIVHFADYRISCVLSAASSPEGQRGQVRK